MFGLQPVIYRMSPPAPANDSSSSPDPGSKSEATAARRPPRRRWRWVVGALLAIVLGTAAVVVVQPLAAFRILGWLFPQIVWRVDTDQPLVALTFDDGPAPDHTPQVLEILARHGARATFFLIGDRAAAHPDLVDRIREEGHEVGNHYWGLRSTLGATDAEFETQLQRTEEILRLNGPVKLFRPPGGRSRSSQLRLARRLGYTCVLGSAYPFDPAHPPTAYIQWLVGKNLAPGVIVILHDGIADPSRMVAALEPILEAGQRKGLRFVTVGELLAAARRPATLE